jgi:hypothetical protein
VARLELTLAWGDYDRTRAIRTGEVKPDGVELNVITLAPEEMFYRMARFPSSTSPSSRCRPTRCCGAAASRAWRFRSFRRSASATRRSSWARAPGLRLETLAGYTYRQGLAPRRLTVDQMFCESTLAI